MLTYCKESGLKSSVGGRHGGGSTSNPYHLQWGGKVKLGISTKTREGG